MDKLREGIFDRLLEIAEIAWFSAKEAEKYEDNLKSFRDLKNSIDISRRGNCIHRKYCKTYAKGRKVIGKGLKIYRIKYSRKFEILI